MQGETWGASPRQTGSPAATSTHPVPLDGSGHVFPWITPDPQLHGVYCRFLWLGFYEPTTPRCGLQGSEAARTTPGQDQSQLARAKRSREKQWVEQQHFTCLPHPIPHVMEREVYNPTGCPSQVPPFPHGLHSRSHLLRSISRPTAEGICLRSSDLTSSRKNRRVSTRMMGTVQTQPICWSLSMSSHPAPSSPSILLPTAGQCWDAGCIDGVGRSGEGQ